MGASCNLGDSLVFVLTDSRTEWAVRWAVMFAVVYAFFFYPPSLTPSWIDWSLPVQLVSGGNLAFYNAGWHGYFGIGAGFAMVMAGVFLSIVFPLLQNDQLGAAYVSLMAMMTVMIIPCITHIGVLNNLVSLTLLLVLVFTEVFWGPILNLRFILPDISSIWTEVIAGNVVPALFYVLLSWAMYIIPPWHSGVYQALHLSSQVLSGVSASLAQTAKIIEEYGADSKVQPNREAILDIKTDATDETPSPIVEVAPVKSLGKELRELANGLLKQTNFAGLEVPIALYGDMGIYEPNVMYPLTSLPNNVFSEIGKCVDYTVFHVAVVLWALGEVLEEEPQLLSRDGNIRKATIKYLESVAELAQSASDVLVIPRQEFNSDSRKNDIREALAMNTKLFGNSDQSKILPNIAVRSSLQEAIRNTEVATNDFNEAVHGDENNAVPFHALLLFRLLADLTLGECKIAHYEKETKEDNSKYSGTMGELVELVSRFQSSWSEHWALPRYLLRLCFIEQIVAVCQTWWRGIITIFSHARAGPKNMSIDYVLQNRYFRRAVQYLVGTFGLYAMATFWPEYSTLLGSSSTGQWTLVAFFVCFRATTEETVHASVLRTIGHGLGALLAWAVNSEIESNGGRMATHVVISFILIWFIPPPFVYPSSIQFSWDIVAAGVLEGILTTYHLTSVLVFNTDIQSATKARALSQCIGAASASLVTLLILPWFGKSRARKRLKSFQTNLSSYVGSEEEKRNAIRNSLSELLNARRDLAAAQEAQTWLPSLFSCCGQGERIEFEDDVLLSKKLTKAALVGFCLEGVVKNTNMLEGDCNDLKDALQNDNYTNAINILRKKIIELRNENKNIDESMVRLYLDILLILR